ncbi:hypothetical protein Cme02nite_28690 [Catellatospora methionotrophica]|uniref:Alkaline shock response membrane anchor protein AmaP n=1 Tax=Catellatospora methionotrophica TaxID=121620 RepID=A0A8J3PEU1_9ACTN|nr:alkaline shock response membrane anchor protein AmaP [Catellatospora methionotrophica]GIG14537.1 hypothetical protein Cme02nite_28690 [Catellatospora methionotrophica]
MNVDRFNRGVLLVLGLLLLAAGAAGALAYTDALGWSMADRAVADNAVSRYVAANGRWLWPLVAAAALLVLVLAVRWLVSVLLATDRARTLAVRTDRPADEHTTLAGPALEAAVRDQIEGYRGVASARVRLTGKPRQPTMAIDVHTSTQAGELAELCQRIQQGVLADARRVLDRPDLPVRLDVDATGAGPRVA